MSGILLFKIEGRGQLDIGRIVTDIYRCVAAADLGKASSKIELGKSELKDALTIMKAVITSAEAAYEDLRGASK